MKRVRKASPLGKLGRYGGTAQRASGKRQGAWDESGGATGKDERAATNGQETPRMVDPVSGGHIGPSG